MDKQIDILIGIYYIYRQIDREMDRQIYRKIDILTDIYIDRYRQIDRQRDGQIDIQKENVLGFFKQGFSWDRDNYTFFFNY